MSIERLELSHLPVPEPKSGVSSNSTIWTNVAVTRLELARFKKQ